MDHLGEMKMRGMILAGILALSAASAAPAQQKSCVPAPQTVYFDWNSAKLRPDMIPVLDAAVSSTTNCGKMAVTIRGHTDATEPPILSGRRGFEVLKYMQMHGTAGALVETIGSREPQVPHRDGVKEPLNRRVVISFQPRQG
jgi:outer membrane protein OmpA-like peptidoglycan-associated protein